MGFIGGDEFIYEHWFELLILTIIGAILWFIPISYKFWVSGGFMFLGIIAWIWIDIKCWLDDTRVYNHKRYRHFVGCETQDEAEKIAKQLNNLGHNAIVLPDTGWDNKIIIPRVYVIENKIKPHLTPYEARKNIGLES